MKTVGSCGRGDMNEQMNICHRCRNLVRSSVWRALASVLGVLCSGHRREIGRERNGLPGWLLVWGGWCWGGGNGSNPCSAGTAGEVLGAGLELSGNQLGWWCLRLCVHGQACLVMVLLLIFFLTPKIIKTTKKMLIYMNVCCELMKFQVSILRCLSYPLILLNIQYP